MARKRHLTQAPIREAVLDVRIETEEPVDPRRLRQVLESLDGFPEVHELASDSLPPHFPSELQQGSPTEAETVIGVRGISRDRDWVIDFRQHGVTFIRRAPYPAWEEYSAQSRPLVEGFLDVANPHEVVRLALRYINHFRLPNRDPRDYFVALPSFPSSLELPVDHILSAISASDPESGLSAHVTHVLLDDLAPERIGFLLDIDVFSDNRFAPRTDQFWGTFEKLRHFKNRLFFELITERNARIHE